jgi:hypothetical protein
MNPAGRTVSRVLSSLLPADVSPLLSFRNKVCAVFDVIGLRWLVVLNEVVAGEPVSRILSAARLQS